jgi:hypothetical protein
MSNAKKCVNGNCSRRKECGTYHQAVNVLEASGANGKFERYTCKKGKCDHYTPKAFVPYGDEWRRETLKLDKDTLVSLLAFASLDRDNLSVRCSALQSRVQALEARHE